MSEQDSFINEVSDEVRREKLFGYIRRYGWIAVTLVVVLVGGAAWNEYRKAQARAVAEARGDAILAALEEEDAARRADALTVIDADGAAAVLITILSASQEDLDPSERTALLDKVSALAGNDDLPIYYRDLAAFKAILLRGDGLTPAERIAELGPLTAPGRAFRVMALEATAHAHVAAGETEAALAILTDLVSDSEATQALRRRASQLIVALGGEIDAG